MPEYREEKLAKGLDAPGVVEMTVGGQSKKLMDLTVEDVGVWLSERGLGHLAGSFAKHKITGKYLVVLSESDLESMGIDIIGDKKAVIEELMEVKRAARRVLRDQVLWKGKEQVFDNCCQEAINTCCFICPVPPARYTLTNNALKITDVDIFRCLGSCRCACCGVTTKQNNIDLNYIKDVDYHALSACCVNKSEIRVEVDTGASQESHVLRIHGSKAQEVVVLVKNAVEDAKLRRERGAKGDFI